MADERLSGGTRRARPSATVTAGDTSQQSHYGEKVGAVLALPDRAQHAAPLHINSAAPAFTFFGPRGTKQSEVFPIRSLTFTENDVALPAERGNLEYAGLSLVYEGNRVKSSLLGRDLNPLGRGDGDFYPAGAFGLTQVTVASLVAEERPSLYATGNSVNNQGQCGTGKDCGQRYLTPAAGISPNKGPTPTPPGPPTFASQGPTEPPDCWEGVKIAHDLWSWKISPWAELCAASCMALCTMMGESATAGVGADCYTGCIFNGGRIPPELNPGGVL